MFLAFDKVFFKYHFFPFVRLFCRSSDSSFYLEPRFVTHIDDPAIAALTKYYSKAFPPSDTPGVCLLDICSSWVSNFFVLFSLLILPLLVFYIVRCITNLSVYSMCRSVIIHKDTSKIRL